MGLDIMHAHLFLPARGWHGWIREGGGRRSKVGSRLRRIADAYTLECGFGRRPGCGVRRAAGRGAGDGPFHSPSLLPSPLLDLPAIKQGLVGVATFTGQCTVCAAAAATSPSKRAGENGNKPVYDRQFSAISLSSPSYVLHTFARDFGLDWE